MSFDHASRTAVLETVADLLGYHARPWNELPDGRRPDVLRFRLADEGMFVADAKHSETPGTVSTAQRLRRYFRWVHAHGSGSRGRGSVVAVCFGNVRHTEGWRSLLLELADDVGVATQGTPEAVSLTFDCHLVVLRCARDDG